MRVSIGAVLAFVVVTVGPAGADEDALERAFVGKPVQALMDLPATTAGLDYYPRRPAPVDAQEYQERLSRNGIGIPSGGIATVSKIKVKKKHIEFQLGAGGGSQMPSRPSVYVPKSKLEDELEDQLKDASSEREKKRLRAELAEERDRRDREQRRREARAMERYEEALSEHSPEEWALMAGSRINVRFDDRVPPELLTPQGLARALRGVIELDPSPEALAAAQNAAHEPMAAPMDLPAHKGESREDVDVRLGPPDECSSDRQDGREVETCFYDLDEVTLEASFAEGVVVRFVITSN